MESNLIQGNELKFKAFPIDQDGNVAALVDLPDQCSVVGFETPAGLAGTTASLQKQFSDLATFKQVRDSSGVQLGGYSPVAASEHYIVKTELAAQLGSHFKIVFASSNAGRSVVVWYRALL